MTIGVTIGHAGWDGESVILPELNGQITKL